MYRASVYAAILPICFSQTSAATFHRNLAIISVPNSSKFSHHHALLRVRGGNVQDDIQPVMDAFAAEPQDPIGEPELVQDATRDAPSSEPTMMKLSKRFQSFMQPGSPDSIEVESLLDQGVTSTSVLKEDNVGFIASAFVGIKTALVNALTRYPSLKYVIAAVVTLVLIALLKEILFQESSVSTTEQPEPKEVITVQPSPVPAMIEEIKPQIVTASITHISTPRENISKFHPTKPQLIISLVLGTLGMIAGTIALIAETAEIGITNASSKNSKINDGLSTGEGNDGKSTFLHLSCDDAKKVGAGAAGGVVASGMVGRAVIIGKVLNFLF